MMYENRSGIWYLNLSSRNMYYFSHEVPPQELELPSQFEIFESLKNVPIVRYRQAEIEKFVRENGITLAPLPDLPKSSREYKRIRQHNWRLLHPDKQKEADRRYYKRKRPQILKNSQNFRDKLAGIPEEKIARKIINAEYPEAVSLDELTPDYYDQKFKTFIEFKRALPFKKGRWHEVSEFFPDLYFGQNNRDGHHRSIDDQIKSYPKPLKVIIVNGLTGEVLRSVLFE